MSNLRISSGDEHRTATHFAILLHSQFSASGFLKRPTPQKRQQLQIRESSTPLCARECVCARPCAWVGVVARWQSPCCTASHRICCSLRLTCQRPPWRSLILGVPPQQAHMTPLLLQSGILTTYIALCDAAMRFLASGVWNLWCFRPPQVRTVPGIRPLLPGFGQDLVWLPSVHGQGWMAIWARVVGVGDFFLLLFHHPSLCFLGANFFLAEVLCGAPTSLWGKAEWVTEGHRNLMGGSRRERHECLFFLRFFNFFSVWCVCFSAVFLNHCRRMIQLRFFCLFFLTYFFLKFFGPTIVLVLR